MEERKCEICGKREQLAIYTNVWYRGSLVDQMRICDEHPHKYEIREKANGSKYVVVVFEFD